MPRFFTYEDIIHNRLPTAEQLLAIVERFEQLGSFQNGCRVVYGSGAWRTLTDRSDIDIATWVTEGVTGDNNLLSTQSFLYHDDSERMWQIVQEVLSGFDNPWFGLIESPENHEAWEEVRDYDPEDLVVTPSTRDHFRLLAKVRKGPYKEFLRNVGWKRGRKRTDDISQYSETILRIWGSWRYSGLDRRNWQFATGHWSALEKFPEHLMRKFLGYMGKLPCPDTKQNIRASFPSIEFDACKTLWGLFEPFFRIDEKYRQVIADIQARPDQWTKEYYEQTVSKLFDNLPIEKICKIIESEELWEELDEVRNSDELRLIRTLGEIICLNCRKGFDTPQTVRDAFERGERQVFTCPCGWKTVTRFRRTIKWYAPPGKFY